MFECNIQVESSMVNMHAPDIQFLYWVTAFQKHVQGHPFAVKSEPRPTFVSQVKPVRGVASAFSALHWENLQDNAEKDTGYTSVSTDTWNQFGLAQYVKNCILLRLGSRGWTQHVIMLESEAASRCDITWMQCAVRSTW
jgi:hypothetical protein